jgi:hypothetical protein
MKYFWKFITLFAYQRWESAEKNKPVGIPHNRDPENPCEGYAPREKRLGDWDDCETDGHYLCKNCAHRSADLKYKYKYED